MSSLPSSDPRRLPAPGKAADLVRRNRAPLAMGAAAHSAEDLSFGGMLRQDAWLILPKKVREAMAQAAGEIIEWWATSPGPETRPCAVVIGRKATVIAEPKHLIGPSNQYNLGKARFRPGPIQELSKDYKPPRPKARGPRTAQPTGPPTGTMVEGLTAEDRGVLGNLPAEAQKALQAPFLDNRVLRCRWHYEGAEDQLDMFGIVLVGANHIMLATGTKLVPAGHDNSSAHWSLKFYLGERLSPPLTG